MKFLFSDTGYCNMTAAGDKMVTKLNEMQINDIQNHNEDVREPIISVGLRISELLKVYLFNHTYQSQGMIYRVQAFLANIVKKPLVDTNLTFNTFQIVP